MVDPFAAGEYLRKKYEEHHCTVARHEDYIDDIGIYHRSSDISLDELP
jgi:hypothetical protein